jgi:hypothetical protein
MLAQSGVGWMGSAVAAEGQITKIGGNRTTPCFLTDDYLRNTKVEDRPKPTSIGGEGFTTSRGMQGIASDVFGRSLYLASGGVILDQTSVIAGDLSPQARLGDGPGKTASFPRMAGLASHPFNTALWVMEDTLPQDSPLTGRIRKIDLTTGDRTVTKIADTGPHPTAIAADGKGNVYVTEIQPSAAYVIGPTGARTPLPTPTSAPRSIAVDVTGTEIYVGGTDTVYRLTGGTWQVIAGPSVAHSDGGSSTMAPVGLAIGHETDGQSLTTRYLYIADDRGRVVRVDLKSSPTVITTVAGGGNALDTATDARTVLLKPAAIAADVAGHVYIADGDNCNVWQLQTPSPFRLATAVTQPPGGPTNTTLPPNNGQTRDNNETVAGTVGNNQANNGTVTQQGPQETQIVPGSQSNVQPQPQTELRIVDQGNVVTTPQQGAQPTVDAVPTPTGAAQFTPAPAPTPTPTPTPTPDAGTVTLADPGTSSAGVAAETAPVVPAAPAAAPVPPPPASAPLPPAAPQPVSNVGLAHGDSPVPARGATRYAMVRNDEEQSVAGLAMAGAGALAAMFLCVIFVAPGAASKPKPRPKGAY